MVKISRFLKFGLVLLALAVLAACQTAQETTLPGAPAPGIKISITSAACPSVEINRNDQVTWTNQDTVERPLRVETQEDGETLADLGVLQPGDSASLTFPEAGAYIYICSEDQAPTGTITVQP